jgi:hypothetical protein
LLSRLEAKAFEAAMVVVELVLVEVVELVVVGVVLVEVVLATVVEVVLGARGAAVVVVVVEPVLALEQPAATATTTSKAMPANLRFRVKCLAASVMSQPPALAARDHWRRPATITDTGNNTVTVR